MRKIIVLLLFVLCTAAQSQSLTLFDIDTTAFPTIKAKFYAFEVDGAQILNLSSTDFEVKENGQLRNVTYVSCPAPLPPTPISSVLTIDISGSMNGTGLNIAKAAASAWINLLPLGTSECAITSFNENNYLNQDFTKDKNKLFNALNSLKAENETDFNFGLLNPAAGSLVISKNGKNKKVIVFLTDGLAERTDVDKIINEAKKQNCVIYSVVLGMSCPQSLKDISEQTGGQYYENVSTDKEAKSIYDQIQHIVQSDTPCSIEWQSEIVCKSSAIEVDAKIITKNIGDNSTYFPPSKSIANLLINPLGIYFKNIPPGTTKDTTITITAINSDFNVTNITSSNTAYKIDKTSFLLAKGQSITLTVSYTPVDSAYSYNIFTFFNNICTNNFSCSGGFSGIKPNEKTLHLTHPNGGEEFVVGVDTLITWEGIPETDTVKLEFSNDNGKTWQNISDSATGLTYIWKKIPEPTSKHCLIRIKQFGQDTTTKNSSPQIEWQKTYGGSLIDQAKSIQQTSDGGYIVAGFTYSSDGDVSENKGNRDYWILKLNQNGKIEWQKTYGGSSDERANSIQQTVDGGYIIAGSTYSNDGDVTENKGSDDCWILKLNTIGEIEWQKTYGGALSDEVHSIQQTIDCGFIVSGWSYSNDGDVNNNKGNCDYWIVKLSSSGKIEWRKTFGGKVWDYANSIQQTVDGGYIVAGYSESNDGDITENKGRNDYWIIKLNQFGEIEWQKTFGGSGDDYTRSIKQTSDGGFIVAGNSNSNDGDVTKNKGLCDCWIIKLNSIGAIEWQKNYGGMGWDYAYSIKQTNDDGFIVAGYSSSNDGDVTENKGDYDIWIIKLNSLGEMEWQKTYGGSSYDCANSIQQTIDDGFIFSGSTNSNDGDINKNKGNSDLWVIKLSTDEKNVIQEDVSDSLFAIVAPQATANDIDMKQCLVGKAKDSVITPFISNIGTYKFRVDSIYFTGNDAKCFSLVSGFPQYEIEPTASHQAEVHFVPNRVGLHSAQINIITQSDTITKNIVGEGIQPQIELTTNIIDFGKIELGKDTVITQAMTIKNASTLPILINDTKHNYPNDVDFTTISGGGSFTVPAGETHKMNLKFKPSELGRTSGTLEFHYTGFGTPAVVSLYGEGVDYKPKILSNIDNINNLVCENSTQTAITLTNKGKNTLVVSEMNLKGNNPSDFTVQAITPISIEQDSIKIIPVIFNPLETGQRTAEIEIKSNASPYSVISIPLSGYKDSVGYVINPKIIDFGKLLLNETKDTSFTIYNSGTLPVKINIQNNENYEFSETSFIIQPSKTQPINVHFNGLQTASNLNDLILFSDTLCNQTNSLSINGIYKSPIALTLQPMSAVAEPGSLVEIPIILSDALAAQSGGITGIDAELSYNSTILAPVEFTPKVIDATTSSINLFNVPITNNELTKIKFIAGLGNTDTSDLKLNNIQLIGGDADIEVLSGTFKLLGICGEGGKRLFFGSGKAGLLSIIPNPADDEVTLTINTIEEGETYIYIYNAIGMEIYKNIINSDASGKKEIKLNTSNYSAGVYYIKFQTPTWNEYNKLIIGR